MESLSLKSHHKKKFQEQLNKLLTVDGFINIFSYKEIIKTETQAFRTVAIEEYKKNEIGTRLISGVSIVSLLILGTVFLFGDTWMRYLGLAIIMIGIGIFMFREGHRSGYVWGHEVGFKNGVNTVLCIENSFEESIYKEIAEIEIGSR